MNHCPHCFRVLLRDAERHVALCKANDRTNVAPLTIPEITHVLRNLLELVDSLAKEIKQLKGGKPNFPLGCAKPELGDDDLQVFLLEGVDALVARHRWPLHVAQKKPYVFDGEWREATPEDVLALAAHLMKALTAAFNRLVQRSGWLDHDPQGRLPQTSSAVYSLTTPQAKASLLKVCV